MRHEAIAAYAAGLAAADEERERDALRRRRMVWGWACLVVLYFSWEATAYRGLFAWAAEWQFDHIGQDLPTFTFGVLAFLFAWPALILFRRRRDPIEPEGEILPGSAEEAALERARLRQDAEAAIDAAHDYKHFLWGFTSALALAVVAALLWTLTLPQMKGALHTVSIAQVDQPDGPAQLAGEVSYGRIASFSRGILFLRRGELYAPIIPPEGRAGGVRYFVEFAPWERADIRSGGSLSHRSGILVRSDLPGAMVRLYRRLGYQVAQRHYVLYASAFTIRWPYYLVAIQFALGALGFLIVSLFQVRHARRIERAYKGEFRPVTIA